LLVIFYCLFYLDLPHNAHKTQIILAGKNIFLSLALYSSLALIFMWVLCFLWLIILFFQQFPVFF